MNTEKFLPIGTVCILKNAKKRVMITGFAAKGKETGDKMFDYMGCLYPEGVLSSDKNLLFDHDQIDKIFYMGYVDDEQKQLMIKLKSMLSGVEVNANSVVNNAPFNEIQANNMQQSDNMATTVQNNPTLSPLPQMNHLQSHQQNLNQQSIDESKLVFDNQKDEIIDSIPSQ